MVTFNHAIIRKDEDGRTFLDLEIQAVFNDQTITIQNTFPSTADYLPGLLQQSDQSAVDFPEKSNNKKED